MNNLKRVLSLALSGIMLVGMMAMGASAADFSDADKISNTDAVNTLVSLGVINGKDDGSYAPEEIVTRSQMAKMICVALNGGKDFTYGTKTTPSYTDIKGHWAESYIEYCTSLNIIAGQGDGTFGPDAPVTGSAAAKMMLVAIGYNADTENMVGVDWEVNTNRIASSKGLYKDLSDLNPSEGLSRDDAAQVIYNACDATMVRYDSRLGAVDGVLTSVDVAEDYADNRDILSEKFNMQEVEGVLSKVSFDDDTKEFTYTVSLSPINVADLAATSDGNAVADLTTTANFTSLYGQKVRVLRTVKSNGSTDVVYGIYGISKNALVTTVAELKAPANISTDKKVDVNGTKYDLDNAYDATPVYVVKYNAAADNTNSYNLNDMPVAGTIEPASTIVLVSNDSNTAFNYAVVIPTTVAKVTYKGTDTITAGSSYDLEDDDVEEGIVRNDFVSIVAAANSLNNKNVVRKLNTLTGTVGATRTGEARIDGTWYKLAANVAALSLGEEYELKIIGSYIYNAEQISEGSKLDDLVLIAESDPATTLGNAKARAYFTDGSSKIVEVTKVDGTKLGNSATVASALYTYKLKDGSYELTTVNASNKAGTDTYLASAGAYTKSSKTLGTDNYIADNAVIFVKATDTNDSTTEYKVYTGAEAKKWENYGASSVALVNNVNGLKMVQAAVITASGSGQDLPTNTGSTKYGFILTTPMSVKDGDDTVLSYTIWTEDGEVDVLDETTSSPADEGMVISYNDKGSRIDTVAPVADSKIVAITGVNGDDLAIKEQSGAASAVIKKDDDTKILYVNTKDTKGVQGGELQTAIKQADGSYITNAWVVAGTGTRANTADLIVFDVNNDIDGKANNAAGGFAGYAISMTGTPTGADVALETGVTKACEGDVVKFTVTTSAAATSDCTITVTPSGTNVDTTAVTVTVADKTASGTVLNGEWVVTRGSDAITGAITLTATGTVS